MSPKKTVVITIPIAGVLLALMFIPVNEFAGIDSYHPESPSPMMIFESNDEIMKGFKITPIGCSETASGLTESRFQVTNTHNKDYDVKVGILFTNNDGILYEKEVIVRILAGQTITQTHLSDDTYDNPICVVQFNGWSEA